MCETLRRDTEVPRGSTSIVTIVTIVRSFLSYLSFLFVSVRFCRRAPMAKAKPFFKFGSPVALGHSKWISTQIPTSMQMVSGT